MRQYHLRVDETEVGAYVLMPGDPGRCELIASRLEHARHVRSNREYTTYTGALAGVAVSVVSTGIGGPSTAIAVEELRELGAHTLVRVGTCGAMHDDVVPGDVVIVQAAVRDEGTSHQYAPAAVPAVARHEVIRALDTAATALGVRHHVGVAVSTDSFHAQRDPGRMPVAAELLTRWQAYRRSGAIVAEMESAALFIVAAAHGMRAGSALAVIDRVAPTAAATPPPDPDVSAVIDVSVEAMRLLIAADAARAG